MGVGTRARLWLVSEGAARVEVIDDLAHLGSQDPERELLDDVVRSAIKHILAVLPLLPVVHLVLQLALEGPVFEQIGSSKVERQKSWPHGLSFGTLSTRTYVPSKEPGDTQPTEFPRGAKRQT